VKDGAGEAVLWWCVFIKFLWLHLVEIAGSQGTPTIMSKNLCDNHNLASYFRVKLIHL